MTQPARFATILVPTDFSETAGRALAFARELTRATGPAHLVVATCYSLPVEIEALAMHSAEKVYEGLAREADRRLAVMVQELEKDGLSAEAVGEYGRPETVIVELARERKADLIVMGTHGRTGIAHVLLGSVAERVARTAGCPVITVK